MSLFYQLEFDTITSNQIQKLAIELTYQSSTEIEGSFTKYLRQRLSDEISLISFNNVIENIFDYTVIRSVIGDIFVDLMACAYLKKEFILYFKNIAKCVKQSHNVRACSIIDDVLIQIVHRITYHISHNYNLANAIEQCRELAQETSVSFHYILFLLGEQYYKKGGRIDNLLMIDSLKFSDRYNLLAVAVNSNNQVSEDIEESLAEDKFFEYAKERLHDDDNLCRALRHTNLRLRGNHLKRLLFENAPSIPLTLDHILEKATNQKDFDIVIQLGSCFPKKKILEIIANQNNYELMDKFFFLYKDYPEVKKLAPFI